MAALFAVTGCSLYPPPQGVVGAGRQGLDGIARLYDVRPLDPASAVPLSKQAVEELAKTDPLQQLRGVTYELTEGNHLAADWLIQTPNVWGRPAASVPVIPPDCPACKTDLRLPVCRKRPDCDNRPCVVLDASVSRPGMRALRFCTGHSDAVVDRFYRLIISARRAVDVTMLQPPADGRFLAALRNALTWLAYSGRPVTVRIMVGNYPLTGTDVPQFLRALMRDAVAVRHSRLRLYVGKIRSCDGASPCNTLSWNHSKIVAVDARRAIVGGHNMWTADYLLAAPTHDLSMEVEGGAAYVAHRFADALWRFVCSRPANDPLNLAYEASAGKPDYVRGCLSDITLPRQAESTEGVPVLAVGRLAAGIRSGFDDQSLIARDLMLGAARQSIRMAQQDVAFSEFGGSDKSWPDSALERMADLMAQRQGDVYLVLSNYGADGPVGSYSNRIPLEAVGEHVRSLVKARTRLPEAEISALLCRHLHLAPLRFGPDATWPGSRPIGLHTKLWMADDHVFYVGSDNLYPVDLQEFGYIVDDRSASAQIRHDYWDPMWQWSRGAAISGDDAPRCMFAAPRTTNAQAG